MAPSRGPGHASDDRREAKRQSVAKKRAQNKQPERVPLVLQQDLANVFVKSFPNLLAPSQIEQTLKPILQEVKGHLFNRDFSKAFGEPEYLDAYAARWSASRSLGYLELLVDVFNDYPVLPSAHRDLSDGGLIPPEISESLKITCLGGGAGSELCAFAGLSRIYPHLNDIKLSSIDIADWSSTLLSLYQTLIRAPSPSDASGSNNTSAQDTSGSLVTANVLAHKFHCIDLLNATTKQDGILDELFQESNLITMMFTLNELYSTSLQKTQTLLLDLTSKVKSGTYFLIVDSAGSYSTVTLDKKEKRYPMQWLLNHTLLNLAPKALGTTEAFPDSNSRAGSNAQPALWESLTSVESCWFRVPDGLEYPLELENMRYQFHLYRRM